MDVSRRTVQLTVVIAVLFVGAYLVISLLQGGSPSSTSPTTSPTTSITAPTTSSLTSTSSTGSVGILTSTTSSASVQSTVSSSTSSVTHITFTSSGPFSVASINLTSGTGSNSTFRGTARLYVVFNNAGANTTEITSIILKGLSFYGFESQMYTCSGESSCQVVTHIPMAADSVANYNTNATGFYVGISLNGMFQTIVRGQTYSCFIFTAAYERLNETVIAT